uniref:RdRp catalytic domain-containing protein n=1 Tax=viral metagenome TaxID=1070528 RepID=A0A2V0RBL4_9ZZZZ
MGGKTQLHLRNRCQTVKNKGRYKYSFDASSFDQTLSCFVMSLFFESIITLFSANSFTATRIKQLMRYELTAGYYHYSFRVIRRRIGGLLSGSGLTNQIGTFCTLFMAICNLLCMGFTINQILNNFDFMVTGDDLVIFSDSELDYEEFINLSHENFGIVYNLDPELIGTPINDVFEFAGSS